MTVSDDHDEYAAAAAQPEGIPVKPYLKTAGAFAGTYASSLLAALPDISRTELLQGGLLAVAAAAAVYWIPYAPTRQDPS